MSDWEPALPDVYELFQDERLRGNAAVETEFGRLENRRFELGPPDIGAREDGVFIHTSEYGEPNGSEIGLYMSVEQARGMAEAFEKAADYVERRHYGDVI